MSRRIEFTKSSEKKKLLGELDEQWGVSVMPHLLIESGKQKIRGYSGHLSKEELQEIAQIARIETVGMYLFSVRDRVPRINFDALPLFASQITRNIIDIDETLLAHWSRGGDLDVQKEEGFFVVRCGMDFVGIGLSTGTRVINYLPKERIIKSKLVKK